MKRFTFVRAFIALIVSFALFGCGRRPPDETTRSAPGHQDSPKRSPQVEEQQRPTLTQDVSPQQIEKDESPEGGRPGHPQAQPLPEMVYRPDDDRPHHDDQRLSDLGIRLFESKRLKLYTDIEPNHARDLPGLIDQAYRDLVDYFGPLPPDRAGTDFQVTGYLMKDEALFREAGLVPGDLPRFEHGRHRRNQFWMREQQDDYYRRHLVIHEATHCFMTIMPDVDAPVWYIEGMAEYFGTHSIDSAGTARFRVMPTSPEEFAGLGRITLIRNDFDAGRARSIGSVVEMEAIEFLKNEAYAWSWALCEFFDTHPRYRQRFREMGHHLQREAFAVEFRKRFGGDVRDLATEWTLFITNLQYGYDTARAAIDFQPGTELTDARPEHQVKIAADRGWQSSGVLVEAGQEYEIVASGQFTLADQPKPWVSEAQGISFHYFRERPLGQLLGCLRTETGETGGAAEQMLRVFTIGKSLQSTAPATGTLYLRLNEAWDSLQDNRGHVTVTIRRLSPADDNR